MIPKKPNDSILPTYKASLKTRTLLKRNEKLLHENLDAIIRLGYDLKRTVDGSDRIRILKVVIKGVQYTVIRREDIRFNPKDPVTYSYFVTASPCGYKQAFAQLGFSPFRDSFSYFCGMKKFDIPRVVGFYSFRRRMIYLENESMKAAQAVASLVAADILAHLRRVALQELPRHKDANQRSNR